MNPYLLQIETLAGCNASCVICGMGQMVRPLGKMDWGVFKKVLNDAKEFDITTVIPFVNGEPLLDTRMRSILWEIKKNFPYADIGWFTNGQLLTEEILEDIALIGNIHTFNISIHGGIKEVYEKSMKLSWDTLLLKLDLLVKINKKLGNPFVIKAQCCDFSLTHDSLGDFRELCTKFGIEPCICCYSNFGGLVKDELGESLTQNWKGQICQRSQSHIYVLNNGDMVSCCFDVNSINYFGNIKKNTLKEIWNSDKHRLFREKHKNLDYSGLDFCSKCNARKFNG